MEQDAIKAVQDSKSSGKHNIFPVPREIEDEADEALDRITSIATGCALGCFPQLGPFVLGGLEDVPLDLTRVLQAIYDIATSEKEDVGEDACEKLLLCCDALEAKIRYIQNLQVWYSLVWRYDPVIQAAFQEEKSAAQ